MHTAHPRPVWFWPGIVAGLASAVAMWITWYLLHLPGLKTPLAISGIIIGAVLIAGAGWLARFAPKPLIVGAVAGGTAGLVGLMLLGSKITRPAGQGTELNPNAPWIVLTFIATSAILGLIGASVFRVVAKPASARESGTWLRWLAMVVAASYLPLLTIGGFVTSSGSGMAVPDWPGTYGSNMFLYPFALLDDPRVFFEHTHRLFGTLAGVCTIMLLLGAFALRASTTVRVMAALLLAGVIGQGLLGGFRVKDDIPALGSIHGILGQGLLVLAVSIAALAGRRPEADSETLGATKPIIILGIASLVCLVIQLTFGSLYRHLGSTLALWSHVGFSLIVTGAVAHVGIFSLKATMESDAGRLIRRVGTLILAVLAIQFTLGFAALGYGSGYGENRPIPTAEELATAPPIQYGRSLVATVHQANGAALAALVGLSLTLALRTRLAGNPRTENTAKASVDRAIQEPNAFANM